MKNRVIIICLIAATVMYLGFYTDVKEKFGSVTDALSDAFKAAVTTYNAPPCPVGQVQSVDILGKPVFSADGKTPICVSNTLGSATLGSATLGNATNTTLPTTASACAVGSHQDIDENTNQPIYNRDGTPKCVITPATNY